MTNIAKVNPEPAYDVGQLIKIPEERIEYENLRILSSCHELPQEPKKSWLVPAEKEVPLHFFRQVFTKLTSQLDLQQEDIPPEAFQRAFERLFFILGDSEPFEIKSFDVDQEEGVGWGEFVYVFKRRKISFKLSLAERIFLTFDNPEASHLGQIVSLFVLLVISISSACFILSTVRGFQKDDPWLVKSDSSAKPEPKDAFVTIEAICLYIFVIEYVIRVSTCWANKPEVFDKTRMLDLVIGFEVLSPPRPLITFIRFVLAPANIVDLVAILPGVIGVFKNMFTDGGAEKEGGGFVVLRLVRLTRIFRAFKNPKLREPVIVIYNTIEQSTKALYVLAFNLLLGVLISGSLMYVVEKGDWDPDTRTYLRYVGTRWNATSYEWEDIKEQSPFLSIPHAMWWAMVTATTVGYGDMFPTTSLGYTIAGLTMMYSLVILALPVGIISGNFSAVWEEYEVNLKHQARVSLEDKRHITSSIQRIDPYALSKKLLVELWHERIDLKDDLSKEGVSTRPDFSEFMGEAYLDLDLELHEHEGKDGTEGKDGKVVVKRTEKLPLHSNFDLSSREVSGSITITYEWTPQYDFAEAFSNDGPFSRPSSMSNASTQTTSTSYPSLKGELKVTLLDAEGLTNCCWLTRERTNWERTSNPYAIVYCYPTSPDREKKILRPAAWRSPTIPTSLNPTWNAGTTFQYRWRRPDAAGNVGSAQESGCEDPISPKSASLATLQEASKSRDPDHTPPMFSTVGDLSSGDHMKEESGDDDPAKLKAMLQHMGQEMLILHNQVYNLSARIDQCTGKKTSKQSGVRRFKDSQSQPHLHGFSLNSEAPSSLQPEYQLPYAMDNQGELGFQFSRPQDQESVGSTYSC